MTGAERAQARAENGLHEIGSTADWLGEPTAAEAPAQAVEEASGLPESGGRKALAAILLLLAMSWIGAFGWSRWQARPALSLDTAVSSLATLSGPLILLALLWLWLGRTPRREAERFTRAVETMRSESNALESVLAIVSERIEANHARLRGEAERLMSLGDEAADRLGRVTYYLSKETASLDRTAGALDAAASAAKVDIGVLLHDLPRAEEQARAVAEAMKDAGLAAHGQAGALEAQFAALSAKGREADELLGGAAQRMAAHVARIESGSVAAAQKMGEASAGMNSAVDAAMLRAAEALDAARTSLDAQTSALFASIEQSRVALDSAGEEAARRLGARLETIGGKLETLAGQLATQDAASQALVGSLGNGLAALDESFAQLGQSGSSEAERLAASLAAVRETMRALITEFGDGREDAGDLIARGREASAAFSEVGDRLQAVTAQADQAGAANKQAERVSAELASHDRSSRALVEGLARDLAALDESFAQLGQSGNSEADRLSTSLSVVRETMHALLAELGGGREDAGDLIARGREASAAFGQVGERLEAVTAQADQAGAALAALVQPVEGIHASTGEIGSRVAGLAEQAERVSILLAAHDRGSRALVEGLARNVAEFDERLSASAVAGHVQAEQLSGTIAALRAATAELEAELAAGGDRAGVLGERAQSLGGALSGIAEQVRDALPQALDQVEAQVERSRAAAAGLAPAVAGVEASANAAAARLEGTEASLERQREALDALLARIDEGAGSAEEKLEALGLAAAEAQQQAARIVSETGPELVEAMVRVRETANQAAERAREAIGAVIPASAAALGDAGRAALEQAVSDTVERQMAELAAVSERALDTARRASERLTRQMLTIGETAAAVEHRIGQARKERDEKESENFSRRVALLIESLNSTAIDVTKILSNDVTDSAWAAYLKGDRGVFTRRAVRLLDSSEAREIARHYDEEPDFREQVNRYIHDFESMLRRILADRDGSPLGVTILSSDMGKLYVALAQAIERLRK
jgi:chromosome segregation ATPase